MSYLEKKSLENAKVAEICIKENCYNVAFSRMYYAIFQKIKGTVLDHKDYYEFYNSHPIEIKQSKTTESSEKATKDKSSEHKYYKNFEHGVIALIIKHFLDFKKISYTADKIENIEIDIEMLYQKRRQSDYTECFFGSVNAKNAKLCLSKMNSIINYIDGILI